MAAKSSITVPGSPLGTPTNPLDVFSEIKNSYETVKSLNQFLTLLTSSNLWLRVAEVGIGVLLIAVGVAHLSNAGANLVKAAPLLKGLVV